MKIEKVNDHQIRCTLTKSDLADRELKISELAYGTEKAKNLFRDMMQQASLKFGFEAEDIPLMIEAIPLNAECIVLIITKVEDPEELDTRFSKFAPSVHDEVQNYDDDTSLTSESATDVLDLFKKIQESQYTDMIDNDQDTADEAKSPADPKEDSSLEFTKLYYFDSLKQLTRAARILRGYYNGSNTAYKNSATGVFILVIAKGNHSPEEFNKICNVLSEYGSSQKKVSTVETFLAEHFDPLIQDKALQVLSDF